MEGRIVNHVIVAAPLLFHYNDIGGSIRVEIRILRESGYEEALLGLSLSFGRDPAQMSAVARRLAFKGDGHNKFLESLVAWLDMCAPRYFWQQFDTYRVGVSKQSESTMHTMTRTPLRQGHFEHSLPEDLLRLMNELITADDWQAVKSVLPESFLQRRIVCINYMALQRIIRQRSSHRLPEWKQFIADILRSAAHPEFLVPENEKEPSS